MDSTDLSVLDVTGVSFWLEGKGFGSNVVKAFSDQEMDGEAILMAMSIKSGPDCLEKIIPALGIRLKVYHTLKNAIEEEERKRAEELDEVYSPTGSTVGVENSGSIRASSLHNSSISAEIQDSSVKSTLSQLLEDQAMYGASQTAWDEAHDGSPVSHTNTLSKGVSPGSSDSPPLSQMPQKRTRSSRGGPAQTKKSLPNPFPIPMFRKYTQQNLEKKKFTSDDRRHIVSVLGHNIVAQVQIASTKDCRMVAEALVRKYPFLVESDSWAQFLYTKCQNINRDPGTKHDTREPDVQPKRAKVCQIKHDYPSLGKGEDDVSNTRNKMLLDTELAKLRPQKDVLVTLMTRTYVVRRKSLLEGEPLTVHNICTEWPLLKTYTYVVLEFDLIMNRDGLRSIFAVNWEKWGAAIIAYARSMKSPTSGVKRALRPCDDKDLTAVRCWAHFLTIKRRIKEEFQDHVDIPFVLWDLPRGTPPSECIDPSNSQPFIVCLTDTGSDFPSQYFIVIEGHLLIECSVLTDAMYILFAVHWVFNLQYHQRLVDFYTFFEEKVLQVAQGVTKRPSANYSNVTTGASTYMD